MFPCSLFQETVYVQPGRADSVISQTFLIAVFFLLEINVIVPTVSQLRVNKIGGKGAFLLSSNVLNVWVSNIVKMRLFFSSSSSLQAFIETMFSSKAPVEESFLYAKVSCKWLGSFCWRQMSFHWFADGLQLASMEVTRVSVERIWFLNVTGNLLDESKICRATIKWRHCKAEHMNKERFPQCEMRRIALFK